MKQFYEYSIKPISELAPYAKNSRTHSKKQVNQIAASIKEFGFTNPILIDDKGGIIAGHGRILAAKEAGMETVPTITITGLTAAQKRALVISDNKLALNAGWDTVLLSEEIGDLKDDGYDISILGFEDDELADMLEEDQKTGLVDDDEVPEVQPEAITKLGDIWILGNHRLMCADSTSIDAVEKLMNGQKADMVFTSPPYNANTAFSTLSKNQGKLYEKECSDNLESKEYIGLCTGVLGNCFLATDGFIFWNVNYNSNCKSDYIRQIIPFMDSLIEQICWKKSSVIPYKSVLRRMWEPIYVFSTKKGVELCVSTTIDNVWTIDNTNSQIDSHRGCFPIGLPLMAIELLRESKIVLDPFGGSGTTLIACEKLGRHARLMELSPRYSDVIIKRWQTWTGQKAILESSGRTFEEVSKK